MTLCVWQSDTDDTLLWSVIVLGGHEYMTKKHVLTAKKQLCIFVIFNRFRAARWASSSNCLLLKLVVVVVCLCRAAQ